MAYPGAVDDSYCGAKSRTERMNESYAKLAVGVLGSKPAIAVDHQAAGYGIEACTALTRQVRDQSHVSIDVAVNWHR